MSEYIELSRNAKMALSCLQLAEPLTEADIIGMSMSAKLYEKDGNLRVKRRVQLHYRTEDRLLSAAVGPKEAVRVKRELKDAGLITLGRGRGGTMKITETGRAYPLAVSGRERILTIGQMLQRL